MHRRGMRVIVSGAEQDVILGSFADGQLGKYTHGTKTFEGAAVTVDGSGNITGGTYNGVTVAAHASRHLPGGADPIFTGTWAANDIGRWNGTQWVPKLYKPVRIHGAAVDNNTTTYADIGNLTVTLNRTGQHLFNYTIMFTTAVNTTGIGLKMAFTGTAGGVRYCVETLESTTTSTLFSATDFTTDPGTTANSGGGTLLKATISGALNVTATGDLSVQFRSEVAASNVRAEIASNGLVLEL